MNSLTTIKLPDAADWWNSRSIGWKRMFNDMQDMAAQANYPPYNIQYLEGEDRYLLTLAVAGYSRDRLEVKVENRMLRIKGYSPEEEPQYVHKGIAQRDFVRDFRLAEHVIVENVVLENGLLTVSLQEQLPEHMRSRVIEIG